MNLCAPVFGFEWLSALHLKILMIQLLRLGFKVADGTITDREEIADHIGSWIQRQADESVVENL